MAEVSQTTAAEETKKRKEKCSTTCSTTTTTTTTTTTNNKQQTRSFVTSIILFGQKVSVRVFPQLWEDFKRVARAEGLTLSHLGEKAVIEYVHRHHLGNPQLPLTPYMDPQAPSPVRVLCYVHLAGVTNEGKVYCRKHGRAWISAITCYSCSDNELRKKKEIAPS